MSGVLAVSVFGWIILVFIWVALAFWPARVAGRKGHSFFGYFIFSLIFFPAALIVAYLVRDRRRWFNARFRSSLRLRRAESGGHGDLCVFLARLRRGSPLNRRRQPNPRSVLCFTGQRVLNRPHSIT